MLKRFTACHSTIHQRYRLVQWKVFHQKLSETLFSEIHAIFSQSIRIYRCKTLKSVTLLPSPTLIIEEDSP